MEFEEFESGDEFGPITTGHIERGIVDSSGWALLQRRQKVLRSWARWWMRHSGVHKDWTLSYDDYYIVT